MSRIIRFFTIYPIWTNVLFFGTLIFGSLVLMQMKYSFFPELPPDIINVQVVYPGASPEEMEEGVVLKIEENVDGLEGIERITSISRENIASVSIEMIPGYDIDKVTNDVKNAIDQINSFPVGIEQPIVSEVKFRDQALSIVVYGNTDLYNLKYIADRFRDELLATEEISQVTINGIPKLEFSIEVSEEALRRYQLRFEEIAAAVRGFNINISGGKLETSDEEILIRGYNRKYFVQDLSDIVVRGRGTGNLVYLKDVATMTEKWEDTPNRIYYNGQPAAILSIQKTIAEDILLIKDKARQLTNDYNEATAGVQMEIIDDRTISLQQRLSLLINNGLIGLLLVAISLTFFMNLRLSFWVAVGIPFSFAGMFIITGMYGITINVISLFGMIIVVGILVDDAIVVGENIYQHYERGKPAMQAAIDGANEVVGPVFTSVSTTIIAFMPFFFLDGFLGKFIWHMAIVVIFALIFSLVESFLILPGHLAHSKGLHPHKEDKPLRQKIERSIKYFTHKIYAPTLTWSLKHKWFTLAMPISIALITIGLLQGGMIRSTFFPFIDGDNLPVNISLTPGTQEAITDSILQRIESVIPTVNDEIRDMRNDDRDVIIASRRELGRNDFGENGSHAGRLNLELLNGEERNLDSYIISNILRERIGPVYEANQITFGRSSFFGRPVSISLLGNNIPALKNATLMLKEQLSNMNELKDITDSDQEGLRELRIELKPRAKALGLTLADIAGQVRKGFFGQEIQRLQRGRDEIRVWVRYREADRGSLVNLQQMRIRTPQGQAFPFSELATYHIERGLIAINHLDRNREIKVEADMIDPEGDVSGILSYIQANIIPDILAANPGIRASFEGQSRSQKKVAGSAARAFPLALIGITILMILVFRSYLQALLVFALIPLGVIGAILGHGVQGIPLNTLSAYGIIALSGIIVNDSIVFIDTINRNLRSGMKLFEAVHSAGLSRLRPILLTTFTTVLGLAPLLIEKSRQAQFLIPMAVSVAYGLLLATFIILLVLPAGFMVLNSIRRIYKKLLTGKTFEPREVEPAITEGQSIVHWESEGKNAH